MVDHEKMLALATIFTILAILTGISQADFTIIQIKLDKPFNITLDSNPTTGYNWTVDFNDHFLAGGNESYNKSHPELIGSGGQQTFTFNPIHEGQTIISAFYKRPWEDTAADERTFDIIIYK